MQIDFCETVEGVVDQAWGNFRRDGSATVMVAAAVQNDQATVVYFPYLGSHQEALGSFDAREKAIRGGSAIRLERNGGEIPEVRIVGVALSLGHNPLPRVLEEVVQADVLRRRAGAVSV